MTARDPIQPWYNTLANKFDAIIFKLLYIHIESLYISGNDYRHACFKWRGFWNYRMIHHRKHTRMTYNVRFASKRAMRISFLSFALYMVSSHCLYRFRNQIMLPQQNQTIQTSMVVYDFTSVYTLQWRHNAAMTSQITSLKIVNSTVYLGADQRKHQSSASLACVRGIHRWPVNSYTKARNAENVPS